MTKLTHVKSTMILIWIFGGILLYTYRFLHNHYSSQNICNLEFIKLMKNYYYYLLFTTCYRSYT